MGVTVRERINVGVLRKGSADTWGEWPQEYVFLRSRRTGDPAPKKNNRPNGVEREHFQ